MFAVYEEDDFDYCAFFVGPCMGGIRGVTYALWTKRLGLSLFGENYHKLLIEYDGI